MITVKQAFHLIDCLVNNGYTILDPYSNDAPPICSVFIKEIIWNDISHIAVVVFDYDATAIVRAHFMLVPKHNMIKSELIADIKNKTIDQYRFTSYHLVRDYEEFIKVLSMFNINVPALLDPFAYIQARFGEALKILDTYQIFTTAYHITISKDLDKFVFIFHNSKELSSYELDLTIDNIDTIEAMIINDD